MAGFGKSTICVRRPEFADCNLTKLRAQIPADPHHPLATLIGPTGGPMATSVPGAMQQAPSGEQSCCTCDEESNDKLPTVGDPVAQVPRSPRETQISKLRELRDLRDTRASRPWAAESPTDRNLSKNTPLRLQLGCFRTGGLRHDPHRPPGEASWMTPCAPAGEQPVVARRKRHHCRRTTTPRRATPLGGSPTRSPSAATL